MIDVIIRKFFLLCLKMAESFENVDNIFCDWAEDKVKKSLVEAIEQVREAGRRKTKPLLENNSEKNTRAVSVSSRMRLNQAQNWPW